MTKMKERPFEKLGKRVAALRKAAGWRNASEFADKAGVAIASLRDIERGVSEGHIDTRQAIADLIGCAVNDFYNEETNTRVNGADLTPEALKAIREETRAAYREALAESKGLPNQFETTSDLAQVKSLISGLSNDDRRELMSYIADLFLDETALKQRKLGR